MDYSVSVRKESKWKFFLRALLLLIIACALHLSLIILFRPARPEVKEERADQRFTILCTEERVNHMEALSLDYWMNYHEPSVFLTPSEFSGFSLVRKLEQEVKVEPASFERMEKKWNSAGSLLVPRPEDPLPPRELAVAGRAVQMPLYMPAANSAGPSGTVSSAPSAYPLCMDRYGRPLPGLRKLLTADRETLKTHSVVPHCTELKIVKPSDPELPVEIRVLQSSGVPALDRAAARAMTCFAASGAELPDAVAVYWTGLTSSPELAIPDAGGKK